ncbi:mitochondrial carrier protein [Ophiostoma piceae UAMH 11346]|uniref:Mitochondrial carrier protein n=1 Tax=Ophiostoma piceae (strain UAMH 11346) TaxID=1262450 RepID=S3CV14_OPHP1|nr:mitochondrial carrier protein [Ophiostoma piceae UAMH 11346]
MAAAYGVPVIPDKDRRTNAATAASAAGVRAISAQALQFYFRAPVKAFFRTRVDYLAYARGPDGGINAGPVSSSQHFRNWLSRTTPGVLTLAVKRHGWSVVPDQVLPPLLANAGVAAVLYTSYLQILGYLHPESSQARRRVYPPPAPTETFVAGFLAGSLQSLVAAPLDAIQARYDHRAIGMGGGAPGNGSPQSMWSFSAAKLREIGLRGIFAGWSLSFVKDSFGNAIFFSVFEYVKAQGYYRYVAYYYGAMDGSMILAQQMRQQTAAQRQKQRQELMEGKVNCAEAELEAKIDSKIDETKRLRKQLEKPEHHHHLHHHHDGRDSFSKPPVPRATSDGSAPVVIRPHYALEPAFLLLAGVSASFCQQVLLHPLTHFQVVHWDLLEDLDAAAKADREAAAARAGSNGTASLRSQGVRSLFRSPRFHFMQTYYHAYLRTWATCAGLAASEGRSRVSWLYRGFWWNAVRQVPSTSAGLIIFELLRRKYGMAGEGVRISQDGYDILLT